MQIGIGISITAAAAGVQGEAIPEAPPYEEPEEEDIDPPAGEPEPPTDTPEDPETESPEPGIDPDFVAPARIEVIENKQGVIRTEVDPNTWAVAYVAAEVTGPEYCEVEIHPSTPKGATMAIGFTTLALPLNGIPGELPGTIAWWSDGRVRQNGATLGTLAAWGRTDRLGLALTAEGGFRGGMNCGALAAALGDLSAAGTLYPFVALYSTGARARFSFSLSRFGCSLPADFYPIGQVPPPPPIPAFRYTASDTQAFNSGATTPITVFGTEVFDEIGAMTSGVFTCPADLGGKHFAVTGGCQILGAGANNLTVQKSTDGGTTWDEIAIQGAESTQFLNVSCLTRLAEGDKVRVAMLGEFSSTIQATAETFFAGYVVG